MGMVILKENILGSKQGWQHPKKTIDGKRSKEERINVEFSLNMK